MALNPIVDSRDVKFVLFEMIDIGKLSEHSMYSEFDNEVYDDVVNLAESIAVSKVYSVNSEADKIHARFNPETKEVTIPEQMKPGLDAYFEAGFLGLAVDQKYGGMGMPVALHFAVTDYFSSASLAFMMFPMLSIGAFNMYTKFLPDGKLKDLVIEKMLSGEWGGTMCLTESDAGSDVGALKSKAKPKDDDSYLVTGQKIFISAGDNDYFKNILHPVLARIEGDPLGTKGISIFMVPKVKISEDGSLGESNDVVCSGIEEKMGINANPTCTLNFGDDNSCEGILMGEANMGMRIMFQMMNEARLFVGSQGAAVSSAAYMHAVTYAKNRIQGKHVTEMTNADAKSVAISQHPDVKRMLLSMKSKVEAMRALTYYCGYLLDLERVETDNKKEDVALMEFLIPILKAGNTDLSWEVTAEAIQVYGGYGYCSDYPVEQYARDSKILSLYEGTNGIQSMDLTFRKLVMNENQYNYGIYKKSINKTIAAAKGIVDDKYVTNMEKGLEKIDEVVEMLKGHAAAGKFLHLFANATPLQQAFAYLTYAWMHLWSLSIAIPKMKELVGDKKGEDREKFLEENNEAAFYSGKVLSGQFYLGSEFMKFFGQADYLLSADTAVLKASDAIFTGALEE